MQRRSRVNHRFAAAGAVAVAVVVNLLGGCSLPGDGSDEPSRGPLSPVWDGFSGLSGLTFPDDARTAWSGTFGGFFVCTPDGSPVTIESVRPRVSTGSTFAAYIRSVSRSAVASGQGGAPLAKRRGTPARLDTEPHHVRGVFREAQDVEVKATCGSESAGPYREIVLVVGSPAAVEARVEDLTVTYRSGGERYAVTIQHTFVLCGVVRPSAADRDPNC